MNIILISAKKDILSPSQQVIWVGTPKNKTCIHHKYAYQIQSVLVHPKNDLHTQYICLPNSIRLHNVHAYQIQYLNWYTKKKTFIHPKHWYQIQYLNLYTKKMTCYPDQHPKTRSTGWLTCCTKKNSKWQCMAMSQKVSSPDN